MSDIRIELRPEFKGETVVLLATDAHGISQIADAVEHLIEQPDVEVPIAAKGTTIMLSVRNGPSIVAFGDTSVHLGLSAQSLPEFAAKTRALMSAKAPGHHYFDLQSPVSTLVLSKDEYL